MSNLQRGKTGSRYVRIRQDYYNIIGYLGLAVGGCGESELAEAVTYATQQREEDLQKVYEGVARMSGTIAEEVESKIHVALKLNNKELSRKYSENVAPSLRKQYFGDEYADLSDPETFIFGLSRYIKAHR